MERVPHAAISGSRRVVGAQFVQEEEVVPTDTLVPANDPDVAAVHVEITANFSERTAPRNDLMREIGALTGTGVDGRGAAARGKMVAKYGGTKGSEEAVALALLGLPNTNCPMAAGALITVTVSAKVAAVTKVVPIKLAMVLQA